MVSSIQGLDHQRTKSGLEWDWEAARRVCLAVARRMSPRVADAEDVAQEALIRAWRMRHACHSDDPAAWLRQIARNETLRALARGRGEVALGVDGDEAQHDAMVEALPERLDFAAALERLAPLDQRLLALRYEADLTHARIAGLLGMPEGTVKVRLHRARRALAKGMASR